MSIKALQELVGVGAKTLARLHHMAIYDLRGLLLHWPLRYEDRSSLMVVRELVVGMSAGLCGIIIASQVNYSRSILALTLRDREGQTLQLNFFNFKKIGLQSKLSVGTRLYCYGKVTQFGGRLVLTQPEYKVLALHEHPPLPTSLTAIYSSVAGLGQGLLRKLIEQALAIAHAHPEWFELLPDHLLQQQGLPNLVEALQFIHHPPLTLAPSAVWCRENSYIQRLWYEQLLTTQLNLLKSRRALQQHLAYAIDWNSAFTTRFLAQLPFKLTRAQLAVVKELALDLQQSVPMCRLLQGDVGCGKTMVAALAVGQVGMGGYQAALMVPTALLARQHYQNLKTLLEPLGLKVELLSGSLGRAERTRVLAAVSTGLTTVLVGTHALFQERVRFHNLALIVIDEQHRFGVHQRWLLRAKGGHANRLPHQLIMTATPIPRTLFMVSYADLDCSIIDELPQGRQTVVTVALPNERRAEVLTKVQQHCQTGQQAYWVCPLIEESEVLQCQSVVALAEKIGQAVPELRIGVIHGRMEEGLKEQTMAAFGQGLLDLLIATTVIEVGVDVANANLMIIENAERLGLVQLHQLRGRVGRGTQQGYCVLMYQAPLGEEAHARLSCLRHMSDGFQLAQKDLELRGVGEVLGTKQSGVVAQSLMPPPDLGLIRQVQDLAKLLLQEYPTVAEAISAPQADLQVRYGQIG